MKIYVAGHNGLVGSAIKELIDSKKNHSWIGKSRQELNLLDQSQVIDFIKNEKPDAIILAAAKVGGIKANNDFPVEFLSENLQIQSNVINAAHKFDVEKLVFLGSSCIYPKLSPQPIKEDYLLTGSLEPTNEPYAIAKIAGLKLIQAYRREYRKNWISVMPTNIYGPRDNFDLVSSHVLPALIAKFHSAKISAQDSVELWGTGTPRREFLYSKDLADAIIFLLENYDGDVALNIGTGKDITIKELATEIANIVGFQGEIHWNTRMPDGTPRKLLDVSQLSSLGWEAQTELKFGIQETYNWFLENQESYKARL
jgi:GDP-L-fucose synthase